MPGVSHLVHMPSHIYIRTGNYVNAEKVNEDAVKGFNAYLGLFPDVVGNASLYLIHNLHMQSAAAMMDGNYQYAIKTAMACRNSFDTSFMSLPPPLNNFMQYVYMSPVFTQIRFGKWDEILAASPIPENYIHATALSHFARGLAHTRKNEINEAKMELNKLKENMKEPSLKIPLKPFNAALDGLQVAEKILEGFIAEAQGDLSLAVSNYDGAVNQEDSMIYNEPMDWLLPARHYLGAALMKKDEAWKAEEIFKEDLKQNPRNGWALFGLYQSQLSQKKNKAAALTLEKFKKVFERSDVKLSAAVF
jgi:tetratricopeptide (TPR) repeat protein